MMSAALTLLAVFLLAVLFQALFAGYETGFVSSNAIRIRYLAEEEGNVRARGLLRYIERPEQMLAMLLIGTNIATMAGTMAITQAFTVLLGAQGAGHANIDIITKWSEVLAMLVVAPMMLVFGEILPKSVFRTHPNRLALALFPIINVFYWLLTPVAKPVSWFTQTLFRRRDKRTYLSPLMSTLDDVRVLVDESAQHGTIDPEEQRMIHAIIDLQNIQAKEIMVPRIDIYGLPDTTTRSELLGIFEASGKTRIPIYHESVDEIIGIVTAHDVLLDTDSGSEDIRLFMRDVMHVPDTITLDDVFEQMKRKKQHIAIVIDEYGGTDGLITLEDILEVIFGQIQDEHDREPKPIQRVGPDAYVIEARMSLEEAGEFMQVIIEDDEVETIGGWLMHVAGRIPAQGEVVLHNGFRMTVLEGGVNFVSKIRLEILPEAKEAYGAQTQDDANDGQDTGSRA
ncbi:MAG TPA: hemolysin family protein [Candidatus Hydrogenedentes bacterium]|nr:hemolysin family protein [Candidatus Hydrogenedentota bacterium]HQE81630.1 hemolysin family protein [Candidatus Hydrogenedentota bacterium]HQH52127.1 hemolysin family protein [Candidatus Hydrogenedentota bacterium]HQM50207.1 hemolysin family protein [Candidatus Hydrogenedentota bacterium]